jgi:hypothetical protein
MPQLHHRDPSIIGLLGASPHLSSPFIAVMSPTFTEPLPSLELPASSVDNEVQISSPASSEALDASPKRKDTIISSVSVPTNAPVRKQSRPSLHLEKGQVADMAFDRPYYGIIVDGIHVHPNSVRVSFDVLFVLAILSMIFYSWPIHLIPMVVSLSQMVGRFRFQYNPDLTLLTFLLAMKVLDPHLKDGIHEWRDGRRFVKEGDSLFVEGTRTLAGRSVISFFCLRSHHLSQACQYRLLLVSSPLIPVSAISRALLGALSAKLSNVLRTTPPSSSLVHATTYSTDENRSLDVWALKIRKGLFVLEPMPILSCSIGKVWFTKPGLRERKYGRNPSEILKLEFFNSIYGTFWLEISVTLAENNTKWLLQQ